MENEKGITLTKLCILIFMLIVIFCVILFSCNSIINNIKLKKFVFNLERIQERVNFIKDKEYFLWEDYNSDENGNFNNYLQSLGFINANSDSNIYKEEFLEIINELNEQKVNNWNENIDLVLTNYYYFNPETLKNNLGVDNVDFYVIVNFYTGNVISKDGICNFVDDGKIIYRQYDTSIGNKLVSNNIKKIIAPSIEMVENYGLSQKYRIFFPKETKIENPDIYEIYYYDDIDDNRRLCSELVDYTYVSEEKSSYFTINNSGNYSFIVEDSNHVEYPKLDLEIILCNPPKLIGGMIGVYWDENGNEIKTELTTDKNWYNYSRNRNENGKCHKF